MYFYTISTTITSLILNYICYPKVYHTITIKQTCYNHILDVIVLVSSTMFQTYDITSYNAVCNYDLMPLYHLRNQIKIKYTGSSIL